MKNCFVFGFFLWTFMQLFAPCEAWAARQVLVQPGDSLWKIALREQASFAQVLKLNRARFRDVDVIQPGQQVLLPESPVAHTTPVAQMKMPSLKNDFLVLHSAIPQAIPIPTKKIAHSSGQPIFSQQATLLTVTSSIFVAVFIFSLLISLPFLKRFSRQTSDPPVNSPPVSKFEPRVGMEVSNENFFIAFSLENQTFSCVTTAGYSAFNSPRGICEIAKFVAFCYKPRKIKQQNYEIPPVFKQTHRPLDEQQQGEFESFLEIFLRESPFAPSLLG